MTNDEDLRVQMLKNIKKGRAVMRSKASLHPISMESYHLQEARALFSGDMQITLAPYERTCTVNVSNEDCVFCRAPISWEGRVYRNLATGEEGEPVLIRTACTCMPSSDPYEEYDKPEPVWSNPGSLEGEWLYPVWRTDRWEFEAR